MNGWTGTVAALAEAAQPTRTRLDALQVLDIAPGTVLFRPGDAVTGYVFVLEGRVGVHLIGPTGRDILLYDVTPGKSCIQTTLGLLGGEDYTGEALAETATRIVLVPRGMFLSLLDDDPVFRRLVFGAFAERMQSMMHLLEQVAFQRVEARLAHWLLSRADGGDRVSATQQEIASAIGSAREVVSRRLEALSRAGLIAHERGEVTLLDRTRLKLLSDSSAV